jgi:DNA repair exonuclease SbcCD ATPase subunit
MKVEKLGVEVKNLKEVKFQAEDRIRELTEKIGELRSMVFQRESSIKEMQSKIKLIDDAVSDIEPKKITKEMEKRKEEIEEKGMKIERLEAMNKELLNNLRKVENITENIKSIENLKSILDRIEKTEGKNAKIKADVDRMAGKAEKFYMEMENRVKEFPDFKIKLDKVDDLTKELTKTIDGINIRLTAFASKQDLESFKRGVDSVIASKMEKNEERIREVEQVLKVPVKEVVDKKNELENKRANVSKLLEDIEGQHKEGKITENSYKEIKVKNESLLKKVDEEIRKLEGQEEFSTKPLVAIIGELQEGLAKMESEDIALTIRTQTEVVRNMLSKLKDVSKKITSLEMKMNFFEILNMIMRTENVREISLYIEELEKTVSDMKEKKLWDSRKESMVKGLLKDVSDAWRDYGYNDIADVFVEGIRKISSSPLTDIQQIETIQTEEPEKSKEKGNIEIY